MNTSPPPPPFLSLPPSFSSSLPGGFYVIPHSRFTTLEELVHHYQEDSDGLCCRLTNICLKVEAPTTVSLSYNTKDEWEIKRTSIKLHKKLGARQFGEVWEGLWNGTTSVAVKIPIPGSKANFQSEVHIMKNLQHQNIIQLYAVCTMDEPIYLVTELMNNWNLLEYLQMGEGRQLRLPEIINIAAQVASGMTYMESHNYIHRDLAARNVSICEGNIAKIADFSVTTTVNSTDGIYTGRKGEKLPILWTAPEAALHYRFSIKSDVWSFGILLSELITHGRSPYPGMTPGEVLAQVEQGYRMPRPPGCPDELYQTMLDCWKPAAVKRPTFEYLKFHLEDDFTSVVYEA